jgi:hypothetical protein
MNAPQNAPPKLFREEAKTGAVSCPACGGPITLKGFGAVERVMCPYCGSELDPQDSGELTLLQQAQRQRRQSVLPLHARGELDGVLWEIIGITWRECNVDGITYPWQEFLLYNPYRGYRYLIFTMTDGHWTLGQVLDGAPQVQAGLGHKRVLFKKDKYKHFQTSMAVVSYVEGEFPWQVHVGDQAVAHDYVAPPYSVSIEEAYGPEGQDVNFTKMHHVEGSEVWKAFGLQGSPPPTSGVGMCQPNPWKKGRWLTWVTFVILLGVWLLATVVYIAGRDVRVVMSRNNAKVNESFTKDVEIEADGPTTLEIQMTGHGLSNAWMYVDIMLISQEREEATGVGVTAEEWHGVSGGESWREGDQRPTVVIGDVKPGKYLLQITPQAGDKTGNYRLANTVEAPGMKFTPQAAPSNLSYDLTIKEDVVLMRYVMLPFVVIVFFPFLYWLFAAVFEGRRWQNSDYATQSE